MQMLAVVSNLCKFLGVTYENERVLKGSFMARMKIICSKIEWKIYSAQFRKFVSVDYEFSWQD